MKRRTQKARKTRWFKYLCNRGAGQKGENAAGLVPADHYSGKIIREI
jgi:hypothetical protein